MPHILITGATGYLGSVLVPLLAASTKNHRITLAVRDPAKLKIFQSMAKTNGLFDWVSLQALLAGDVNLPVPDVICHLAKGRNSKDHREIAASLELMAAVVGLAREWAIKKFIFTSSQAVYGMAPTPWSENTQPAPATLYGMMGYASELLLQNALGALPQMDIISLRLAKLVGPAPVFRHNQGETPHLMAAHALAGRQVTISRGSNQTLDFLDVRDAAAIILILVEQAGIAWPEVLNLGGGNPITLTELARLTSLHTAKYYGKPLDIVVADQGAQVRHFGMSIARLRRLLPDFKPTSLEKTIADTCALLDSGRPSTS